ncbi:MAG: magnesium transporter [Bdellovibrionaceae bacterium]|nr:magnesium transporter [Bdellovibrionales bacterium]MCB9084212.1 magnesium transporter [Pseudobdellovibrionaceae bacterium]
MKLNPTNTAIIKRLLVGRSSRPLHGILAKVEAADLATLMSTLNSRERRLLLTALRNLGRDFETLVEVPEQQLAEILEEMNEKDLLALLVYAPEEDGAYFLTQLGEARRVDLLEQMEAPRRARIGQFLAYPEDSAGRMMQTKVFSLPIHLTASEGLEVLRNRAQEESIYYIYCVDDDGRLAGVASLRALAIAPAATPLAKLIKKELVTVRPEDDSEEVARLVSHYDFIALPVVNENGNLLGVITVDDVLDIIQEQATANLYAQAGLKEDDRVYTTTGEKIKKRLPWMFLNLCLAALASSVVSLFEDTMSTLIVLASVKNIVAGISGNTAIQTLTVVTRGIATGDFSYISQARAVIRETVVGMVLGLITGLACGILVYVWKGSLFVGIVIFVSMLLNSLVAACWGALIPLILQKLDRDPAIGSGVLVTMTTDILSFFSFLGIAALGLRFFGDF